MKTEFWHCCVCGKFCGYNADSSTAFGSSADLEPPEPDFYCEDCAQESEEQAVKDGHVYSNWIPAQWEWRAAKRIGLVWAGPKGAAWSQWFKPNEIPAEYVERTLL